MSIVRISAYVAPRAGAWIETALCTANSWTYEVAPRAGAGLKLYLVWNLLPGEAVALAQGRGLKPETFQARGDLPHVAPRAGAWIETIEPRRTLPKRRVAPRAGRGLKPGGVIMDISMRPVAPRAGAWIETSATCLAGSDGRRPSRRGVD